MNEIDKDKLAYSLAKQYLLNLKIEGVTVELIEKYLSHSENQPLPDSIAGIYLRLLESAQNANMKSGVVGKAIGGVSKLGGVLCDFQPKSILEKYEDWESVLNDIEQQLTPIGQIRRTSRSIWPQYCRTILSAAKFLAQFQTADDFYRWVDFFDADNRARAALPMLLDNEIQGVGFALACDFLKELGYVNFAKPDVHIRDIFTGLNLCPEGATNYQIFKAVVRLAENVGVSPYNADKLFWLIGSGYFYQDEQIGNKGRIGSYKMKFIAYAREKLV
jgi:hypothetical protein